MARLGSSQHRRDGLRVAHLTHHDHIRILTHGIAQSLGETHGVGTHFTLGDGGDIVAEEELDGVLDTENVDRPHRRDQLDHRRQRRRLAAAGGTGDQNETHGQIAQLVQDRRQIQIFDP